MRVRTAALLLAAQQVLIGLALGELSSGGRSASMRKVSPAPV